MLHPRIGTLLEEIMLRFDRQFLKTDPVSLVHRYRSPGDQEVVSLITALLAFGNAKAIIGSVKRIIDPLGSSPKEALMGRLPATLSHQTGHRWVRTGDILLLLEIVREILVKHHSLESFFLEGFSPQDHDVGAALHQFSRRIKKMAGKRGGTLGFRYFFPSPEDGSACKRLNMWLRWIVRPHDGIDLGLWSRIPPSKLIIPLDIHLFNFARRYRLSRYKTPHWKMACEVTSFLRQLDPADPVKYDFAICHYGMEQGWK